MEERTSPQEVGRAATRVSPRGVRAWILDSPDKLATLATMVGVLARLIDRTPISIGWTMVLFLWLVPLVAAGAIQEVFWVGVAGPDRESHAFASRENRLRLIAFVTLPALGFALDADSFSIWLLAPLALAFAGICACAQLHRAARRR